MLLVSLHTCIHTHIYIPTDMHGYIYIYIETCMHILVCLAKTYIHTHIHTTYQHINACLTSLNNLHTYNIHACVSTLVHTWIHTYIDTCICIYVHIHGHVCMHSYIHACIHIYIFIHRYSYMSVHIYTYIFKWKYACIHPCMYGYTDKYINQFIHIKHACINIHTSVYKHIYMHRTCNVTCLSKNKN